MLKICSFMIFVFLLDASVAQSRPLKTHVSRNFIYILSSAGVLENRVNEPLYSYECIIQFTPNSISGHLIECTNQLDTIIKLQFPLLHTNVTAVGRNLSIFRLDSNAFNQQLFNTLKNLAGSKEVFVSQIHSCPGSKMNCSESYSTDLHSSQPSGSMTCLNKNKTYSCILSPGTFL